MKNLSGIFANRSAFYRPTQWPWKDREGRAIRTVVYAGREYTEYRNPSGEVTVELHRAKPHE